MKGPSLLVLILAACGGTSSPAQAPAEPVASGEHEHTGSGDSPPAETPPAETPPAETPPDPAQVKAELVAAEQAAYEKARPVFEAHCARCHSKTSKKAKAKTLGHFDMTSYPFSGHHAAEISAEVREVLGIGGGKATMPKDKPGSVKGDELALVASWADAYDKAHQGGAHEDRGHGSEHHQGGHKH